MCVVFFVVVFLFCVCGRGGRYSGLERRAGGRG